MKILLAVWSLTDGGAERVASLWAKGFVSQGYSVDFLLGINNKPITYEIPSTSKVHYLVQKPIKLFTYCHLMPDFLKIRQIRKVLKTVNPDLVICVIHFAELIRKAIGKNTIPIIMTEHNSYERPGFAPMSRTDFRQKFDLNGNYLATTLLTNADLNVLVEKKGKEWCKKTFVLPNPCSFKTLQFVPRKEKIILAAGRLDAWKCKGFDLLLKAWSQISRKFPDWKLNIAGGGDVKPLKTMAQELAIESRVNFLGFVDILSEFQKSDVFVLSSRYEGFGMVLVEAMSQGCACIACDYKGRQKEIIENEEQGLICAPNDAVLLAQALERMLEDENYRKECQKYALERSKDFALPKIMERWNEIFKDLGISV